MAEYIVKARLSDLFGITNKGELIRCKDCKKRKNNICHNPNTFGAIVTDDYYCADGEPKEGELE